MGTNEQIMAWFMDSYSVHIGYALGEIVTGNRSRSAELRDDARRPVGELCFSSNGRSTISIPLGRARDRSGFRKRRVGCRWRPGLKSRMKVVGIGDHTREHL